MTLRRHRAPAGALAMALVTSCGGGGTSTAPPSKIPVPDVLSAENVKYTGQIWTPITGEETSGEIHLYVEENAEMMLMVILASMVEDSSLVYALTDTDDPDIIAGNASLFPGSGMMPPGMLYVEDDGGIGVVPKTSLGQTGFDTYLQAISGKVPLDEAACQGLESIGGDPGLDSLVQSVLAKCALDAGDAEQALEHADAALEAGPHNALAMLMRASALAASGGVYGEEAMGLVARAYVYNPQSVHLYLTQGGGTAISGSYLWKDGWPFFYAEIGDGFGEGEVVIRIDPSMPNSLTYSLCKAVFRYDPDLREAVSGNPDTYTFTYDEEFTCQLVATHAYKHDAVKDTQPSVMMDHLVELLDARELRGHVMVNVVFASYPDLPFDYATEYPDYFEELVAYVLRVVLGQEKGAGEGTTDGALPAPTSI